MNPSTINDDTLQLSLGFFSVASTVSYNVSTRTATIRPIGNMTPFVNHTGWVRAGPTGVKDVDGNELAGAGPFGAVTWNFTTSNATVPHTDGIPRVFWHQDPLGDYDGDGKADVAVWRPLDRKCHIRLATGRKIAINLGRQGHYPVPGDYDGDGRTDCAVFDRVTGNWHVGTSPLDPAILPTLPAVVAPATSFTVQLGDVSAIPIPGDYDGDGDTDYAVWDAPSWFVKSDPLAPAYEAEVSQPTGFAHLPAPGDYNGDGQTDYAVWSPIDEHWYYGVDSDNPFLFSLHWPDADWGAIPVPADYDGDGATDFALFTLATGRWQFQTDLERAPYTIKWGLHGDMPVPGDYGGDGVADIAVWRPPEGRWYVRRGDGTTYSVQHGLPGDVPLPGGDTSESDEPEETFMWWARRYRWGNLGWGHLPFHTAASGLCDGPTPHPFCLATGPCAPCLDCNPTTPCTSACPPPICGGCGDPGSCQPCDPGCQLINCPEDPACREPVCPGDPLCAQKPPSNPSNPEVRRAKRKLKKLAAKAKALGRRQRHKIKDSLTKLGYQNVSIHVAKLMEVPIATAAGRPVTTTMSAVAIHADPPSSAPASLLPPLNVMVAAEMGPDSSTDFDAAVIVGNPGAVADQMINDFTTIATMTGGRLGQVGEVVNGIQIFRGKASPEDRAFFIGHRALEIGALIAALGGDYDTALGVLGLDAILLLSETLYAMMEYTVEVLPRQIRLTSCLLAPSEANCPTLQELYDDGTFLNGQHPPSEQTIDELAPLLTCAAVPCGTTRAPAGCGCDLACIWRKDCCADACTRCGACYCADVGCGPNPGPNCSCSVDCIQTGNCCPDACDSCGACGCGATFTLCPGPDGPDPPTLAGCYCGPSCAFEGDCCPDACAWCGSCSCANSGCVGQTTAGCYCDVACLFYEGSCCHDFCDTCGQFHYLCQE